MQPSLQPSDAPLLDLGIDPAVLPVPMRPGTPGTFRRPAPADEVAAEREAEAIVSSTTFSIV